jgi:hypothetical protein
MLGGCASVDFGTSMLVSPGKYDIYTCKEIEERTKTVRAREQELQALMARSAQGPGGGLINAIAYNSDYLTARGELKELEQSAASKQCAGQNSSSSQRSVF